MRIPSGAMAATVLVGGPPWPMTRATGREQANLEIGAAALGTYNWSRDGRWLSGNMDSENGFVLGHALYDLATGTVRQLNTDAASGEIAFLPGHRQVVFFNTRGKLIMQDIASPDGR